MMWAGVAAATAHLAVGLLLTTGGHAGGTGAAAPTALSVRYLKEEPSLPAPASAETASGLPAQRDEATPDPQAVMADAGTQAKGDPDSKGKPRHYYDVSEVDTPAVPTPDWALDLNLLTRNGVQSLKVEVLVSETGRAERCTVLNMQPARPMIRALITKQLCDTHLTPAIRSGVAVPSVRHVEILVSDE